MAEKSSPGIPGDSVIVDWESPQDPRMPRNWSTFRKWRNVMLISMLTFVSPFGSSMLAPSMGQVMAEFHCSNTDIESLTVSIYVLGYVFGPLLYAPLSELFGRQLPLLASSALFTITAVACALSVNLPMLIVFRFLSGVVGSAPLSLGPASIGDMFEPQSCGKAMAAWNLPVLFGPALGPLVGSYITQSGGWRWNCWFLAITMGSLFLVAILLLRETHPPTILERHVLKMRKQNHNYTFISVLQPTATPRCTLINAFTRPVKLLLLSPIVLVLSLCSAISYGFIYLLFTSMTSAFTRKYGIGTPQVGLMYLGFGVGNILGNLSLGYLSDRFVKRMAVSTGMKPEYRLIFLIPGSLLMPIGLLIYGWTLEFNLHWMVPEIGLFIFGLGTIYISMPVNTYLVHAFPSCAASATAANTIVRSLLGGLLALCGGRINDAVGDGWGNSILAFIGLGFIFPVFLVYRHGEYLRMHGVTV
ncbi:hypothetical protein PFICI_09135 [Pestalotiopsis fici W106-1]|uniref:Major facilitator superfamily (MFS) profile domain-containing protein n=1 Tax=Pestalotiopsis fici (strain W106-1 / CGMCC3.15140) TaxID=1229662 RepID=W3X1N9_PESFW|nr:uncharacterized protein PFICI_09135 [Pestalotiopsis fici W106-1]ETS79282.1 hypothetical protein PFICI_09135 [Pestalotiopsis fici W106-1]